MSADLILAALVAGSTAGVTNVATAAVQDAYAGLKGAIRGRLAQHGKAEVLDGYETDPGVWQADLTRTLDETGIAGSDDILAAARALLALAGSKYQVDARDAKGLQVGDHNEQTNYFS